MSVLVKLFWEQGEELGVAELADEPKLEAGMEFDSTVRGGASERFRIITVEPTDGIIINYEAYVQLA